MTRTKQGVATWLFLVAAAALLAASLITDTSGANLELAPVFVGAALALVSVRLFLHRSGSRRH
jgi:uncharacterized membrane protein YgaE (UPF0421/DUF939 family)